MGLPAIASAGLDHSVWDQLLREHVHVIKQGQATQVDYAGLNRDAVSLVRYLNQLKAVPKTTFEQWPAREQLAFLINAYNAWTVELVRHKWEGIRSIKELGRLFKSPWQLPVAHLFGEKVTLDYIEHELIRAPGRYDDYRIHFAVNCASVGCPALRSEAYTGAQLERQLTEQTRLFMMDRTRNRLENQRLKVSSIFKWYQKDFSRGWRSVDSLEAFLLQYADALGLNVAQQKALTQGRLRIDFLQYDWRLNAFPQS